jgi:hypothetical protein
MWRNTKWANFFSAHAIVFAMSESGNMNGKIFPILLQDLLE